MDTSCPAKDLQPRSLPDTDDKLTWALFYAREMNIPIFPLHETDGERCSCGDEGCEDQGKHPRWNRGNLESGVKDATLDEEMIKGWWTLWPEANIGGAMGRVSGITVADGDTLEVVDFLKEHAPDAPSQTTGSGMKQFFFSYDEDLGLKNWQGIRGGLDIRTQGGYVVLPPSRNAKGPYCWDSIPFETSPMPPEILEAIRDHRKKEKRVASSTSRKIGKVLEGVSSGSATSILDRIVKDFSKDEKIPVGSRHIRLLEIGGHLRRKAIGEDRIVVILHWMNENLAEEPLTSQEMDGIAQGIMRIQKEVNNLVDTFEAWLKENAGDALFKGMAGGTNLAVIKVLLHRARMFGVKGIEGIEVVLSRRDMKDHSGVSRPTLDKVIQRVPFLSTRKDEDNPWNASTIVVHYPNGIEVDENGEVSVVPFGGEFDRGLYHLDTPFFTVEGNEYFGGKDSDQTRIKSRWGGGMLGHAKADLLESIFETIGTGSSFAVKNLSFTNKSEAYLRRHLVGLTNEKKLGKYGLVEKRGRGEYALPGDFKERYARYREDSGEVFMEEKGRSDTEKDRNAVRYFRDLKGAVERGEDLGTFPMPEGMAPSVAQKILGRARDFDKNLRDEDSFYARYRERYPDVVQEDPQAGWYKAEKTARKG